MKAKALIWMDLEMTGLDPERDRIIEIATLVTDADLNIIAEGPELVVHQSDALLNGMDDWNRTHHGASGLTEQVRASSYSEEDAETETLRFLRKHSKARTIPLAGNSIHQDRRFLVRYMPKLNNHLHYRNVDVSSVKELAVRWYPGIVQAMPRKVGGHRALDDIRESIEELKFYRAHLFK